MNRYFLPLLLVGLLTACQNTADTSSIDATVATVDVNPAADGFDLSGSDERAIAIADSVVKYHGGRKAYDDARYFSWNFFGARTLDWDKEEQRVRIEVPSKDIIYLLDYSNDDLTGAVRKEGVEMTDPDSLSIYLQSANSMFINDSYWLVQPFKLKDSGVTLKYVGEMNDPLKDRASHVLRLTFKDVGDTPGNAYQLYVDGETYRINTWHFFRSADDTEPAIESPFDGYREYEGLLLSGDRGGPKQLTDIVVTNEMDDTVFTQF
ncbi:hypothetical protein LEM8419_01431 [Neolewinella maritima]|uniref:Outer membrane lipoprotein-sorting protein n=1 Tax=Neolewinella maritima TaxID=1383882 RepID=A0ABN8F4Q3_9BACT|nr:DUF6503 family protein [Neolewinella maritima]CAH1000280.1 hypothetical protein LEM8419_01431 [Neolewinella maritima]